MASLQLELDVTHTQLDQEKTTHAKRLQEVRCQTISDLTATIEALKADIGKLQVRLQWILDCHLEVRVTLVKLDEFSLFHRLFFFNNTELKIFGRHRESNPGPLA